jgi:hypothetical protein
MSVTFTAELDSPIGFTVACCQGSAEKAPRYGTYEDARVAHADVALTLLAGTVMDGCEFPDQCLEYGTVFVSPVFADPSPEVQTSNVNAKAVLDLLGYGADDGERDPFTCGELSGDEDATDFLGRVLMALALTPADAGVPVHRVTTNMVDCGRPVGYLQGKLTALQELAEWCAARNRRVQWA